MGAIVTGVAVELSLVAQSFQWSHFILKHFLRLIRLHNSTNALSDVRWAPVVFRVEVAAMVLRGQITSSTRNIANTQ
jgi:hypothetical protein